MNATVQTPLLMNLSQAHAFLPGSVLRGDPQVGFARVHTDTRSLRAGDLYVALRGERFDGHEFLAQARDAGAAAALAERGLEEAGLNGLQVNDSLLGLQQLARAWRAELKLPLVAITGSNGKTTVTQMVASVLRAWLGDGAAATQGNLNNHIGVPLTLLCLRRDHRAAVVELGMNHPGEIAQLAQLAQPTVALVNNAQREHQEFMHSVEAVARENGAVLQALPPDGVAVFPADDTYAGLWAEMAGTRRVLSFAHPADPQVHASAARADVIAQAQWRADHWQLQIQTPEGELAVSLHIAGSHNVRNALAACACSMAVGVPLQAIAQGLSAFRPVSGRSRLTTARLHGQAITLVDDTYNANPDSVRAAIDVLLGLPGPRTLVLGDMGEVGDQGPAFHAEVGHYARQQGIDTLWTVGDLCVHAADAYGVARHFDSVEALVASLSSLPPSGCVLVKGSRFMKMERVVRALQEGC